MNPEELLGPRCSGISGIGEGISVGESGGVEGGVDKGESLQKMLIPASSNSKPLRRRWEKETSGAHMVRPSHGILKTY